MAVDGALDTIDKGKREKVGRKPFRKNCTYSRRGSEGEEQDEEE